MAFKTFTELQTHFRGSWRDVLWHFGIELPPTNKQSPCPICGGGDDRFRFEDKGTGRWFCRWHDRQSGDGMDLLRMVKGWDNVEVIKQLNVLAGTMSTLPAASRYASAATAPALSSQEKRAKFSEHCDLIRANAVRAQCAYLAERGYIPPMIWQLAATVTLRLADNKKIYLNQGGTLLALTNAEGETVGLHCTYPKGKDWEKRLVPCSAKKGAFHAMTEIIPGRPFVLCEGYATGHALTLFLPRSNVIMAVDAGNLVFVAKTILDKWPDAVIVVAGDNDDNGAGMTDALKVRKISPTAGISIPDEAASDWDDIYRACGADTSRQMFAAQLERLKDCLPGKGY